MPTPADRRAGVDPTGLRALGLIPRCLPWLVFASTGLANGLIDRDQFVALVIMVTTVVGLRPLDRRLMQLRQSAQSQSSARCPGLKRCD
jgi:hypothetical protein